MKIIFDLMSRQDDDDYDDDEESLNLNYDDIPIRKNVRDHDGVLKSRSQKEMLRLPRVVFPDQKQKKRRRVNEDDFGFVVRPTDSYATRLKHEREVATERLPTTEFSKRRLFRDSDGNFYSPAKESDELYRSLVQRGMVDKIDPNSEVVGFPKKRNVSVYSADDGTKGDLYGKVLLFAELKRNKNLIKWPAGEVELIDPSTEQYFTGQVSTSFFKSKSKGGYVVLKDVVSWGQISDPREFNKPNQNKK